MDPCPGCRTRDQRIRQLEAQARRDTDALNDAHEQVRVYRRLAHRFITENDRLRLLLASDQEDPCRTDT